MVQMVPFLLEPFTYVYVYKYKKTIEKKVGMEYTKKNTNKGSNDGITKVKGCPYFFYE